MIESKLRSKAFILLEVLITLSILGVAIGLFWQSRAAERQFHSKLLEHYAVERLEHDLKILADLNLYDQINITGYSPLKDASVKQIGLQIKRTKTNKIGLDFE